MRYLFAVLLLVGTANAAQNGKWYQKHWPAPAALKVRPTTQRFNQSWLVTKNGQEWRCIRPISKRYRHGFGNEYCQTPWDGAKTFAQSKPFDMDVHYVARPKPVEHVFVPGKELADQRAIRALSGAFLPVGRPLEFEHNEAQ